MFMDLTKYGTNEEWKKVMECFQNRMAQGKISYIIYCHDETNIHKNDHERMLWCHENVHRSLPKGKGKGCCISDFYSAAGSALIDEQGVRA